MKYCMVCVADFYSLHFFVIIIIKWRKKHKRGKNLHSSFFILDSFSYLCIRVSKETQTFLLHSLPK